MEKTCGIFIVNQNKEILIGKPSGNNSWSIPKGRIESGEMELDAALRELYEEANIALFNYRREFFIPLKEQEYLNRKKILKPFVLFNEDSESDEYSDIKCNSYFDNDQLEIEFFRWQELDLVNDFLPKTQRNAVHEIRRLIQNNWPFDYEVFLKNTEFEGFEKFF